MPNPIIANRLPYTRWMQVTNRSDAPMEDVVLEIDTFGIGAHRRIEVGTISPRSRADLPCLRRHEKVDGVRARYRVSGKELVTNWQRAQGISYFRWLCLYLTDQGALTASHRTQGAL